MHRTAARPSENGLSLPVNPVCAPRRTGGRRSDKSDDLKVHSRDYHAGDDDVSVAISRPPLSAGWSTILERS
jgi:hypothetical protein